ncbi:MAG: hypothetical protein AAGG09_04130 [Pseudomonadota bacterium]
MTGNIPPRGAQTLGEAPLSERGAAGEAAIPASFTVVSSGARLSIAVTRAPKAAQFAPEAVWFEAVPEGFDTLPLPDNAQTYRPEFHEIEYEWAFGDAGARFTAPQNVPDAYRDANSAIGQITAHVFRTGGRKRVTCTARRVVDPETLEIEEARAKIEIEIGDPDTLWTDANTVVVALDGDFTGAPPGARATTVAHSDAEPWWSTPRHWLTQVNRLIGAGERSIRVLFKHGEFYPTALFKPNRRAPHIAQFVLFGAWGDPRQFPPTFPRIGLEQAGWSNSQPFVFQGLAVSMDYNPYAQTGLREVLTIYHEAGYALFSDMLFQRGGTGALMQPRHLAASDAPAFYCFHNCAFERIATYGLFTEARPQDRIAYLGCRDIDEGAAPHGDSNRMTGNAQGPMRLSNNCDWVIAASDFFSRHGWSGQGTWPGTDIAATHEQPCLRLFSGGPPEPADNGRVSITRCAGEGGFLLSAASLPAQEPPPRGNLVVDQVIHVLSASGTGFVLCETGAVTIRNGLWIKPDVTGAFGVEAPFYFAIYDRAPELQGGLTRMRAEPIRLHNNTFVIDVPTELSLGPFGLIDQFDYFEEANNVFYLPKSPGNVRHEDLSPYERRKLWDLRWLGRLETADNGILRPGYAARDGAANLYRPLPSSAVVGHVGGLMSVVDLLGNRRDRTQSRGALEPRPGAD